jgi:hypothetical protein
LFRYRAVGELSNALILSVAFTLEGVEPRVKRARRVGMVFKATILRIQHVISAKVLYSIV